MVLICPVLLPVAAVLLSLVVEVLTLLVLVLALKELNNKAIKIIKSKIPPPINRVNKNFLFLNLFKIPVALFAVWPICSGWIFEVLLVEVGDVKAGVLAVAGAAAGRLVAVLFDVLIGISVGVLIGVEGVEDVKVGDA